MFHEKVDELPKRDLEIILSNKVHLYIIIMSSYMQYSHYLNANL